MRCLALASAVGCVVAGSLHTCGEGGKLKLPCLPGTGSLGVGIDAVTGKTKVVPLVQLTYNKGVSFTNPFTSETFAVPDQVTVAAGTHGELEHSVYRSATSYAAAKTTAAGLSADTPFFSASADVSAASALLRTGSAVVAESRQSIAMWEATLAPTPLLAASGLLRKAAATLPPNYDPAAYARFVRTFGTHVIRASTFGGHASISTTVAQSFSSQHSDSDVEAELQVQWSIFGGSGSVSSNATHSTAWMSSGSTGILEQQGGDPSVSWGANWTEWAATVPAAPVQIQVQLQHVADLIQDGAVAGNVRKAVADYAARFDVNTTGVGVEMELCGCTSEQIVTSGGHVGCSAPGAVVVEAPFVSGFSYTSSRKGKCCRLCARTSTSASNLDTGRSAADASQPAGNGVPAPVDLTEMIRLRGAMAVSADSGPVPTFPTGIPPLDVGEFSRCNCDVETGFVRDHPDALTGFLVCASPNKFIASSGVEHEYKGRYFSIARRQCCGMCVGVAAPNGPK